MNRDELVTLHVRQEAEKILATLPSDPEWLITQRREDLLDDVLRWSRRRRRNRIMREAARDLTTRPGHNTPQRLVRR